MRFWGMVGFRSGLCFSRRSVEILISEVRPRPALLLAFACSLTAGSLTFAAGPASDVAPIASTARGNSGSSGAGLELQPGLNSDQPEPLAVGPAIRATDSAQALAVEDVGIPIVRIAYIIPSNRVPQPHGIANLQWAFTQYREWYRDQMERFGFGLLTFRLETEADGTTPKVHLVTLPETDEYFRGDIWARVMVSAGEAGVPEWAYGQVWFFLTETHLQAPDGSITGGAALGASYGSGYDAGLAMIGSDGLARFEPAYLTDDRLYHGLVIPEIGPYPLVQNVSFPWFEQETLSSVSSSMLGAGVHELSHGFGLPHDFRNDQNFKGNLMGNGLRGIRGTLHPERYGDNDTQLGFGEALALSVSPYFNPRSSFETAKPFLAALTTGAVVLENGLLPIRFMGSDTSGLRAAWLQWEGELVDEMVLTGMNIDAEFATPYYRPGQANNYTVSLFDIYGNKQTATVSITPPLGQNRAPLPFITVTKTTVRVGEAVLLDAGFSSDHDGDAAGLRIEWDLNSDRTYDTVPTTTKELEHRFSLAGDWLVRARVTDRFDATSESAPLAIRVTGASLAVGDLNGDGCVDRGDLSELSDGIRSHSADPGYDLNSDGRVDMADARFLALRFSLAGGAPCPR